MHDHLLHARVISSSFHVSTWTGRVRDGGDARDLVGSGDSWNLCAGRLVLEKCVADGGLGGVD